MKTKTLGIISLPLVYGAVLFAADKNITSDTLWDTDGVIGGQTYTSADKIHIKTNSPTAIPTVTFDFGAGNSTTVDALVLGWNNGQTSAAGNLRMNSGTIYAGGVNVAIPVIASTSDPSEARESTLIMNSGTELVITGKDDAGVDYNGFFIAKSGGTPNGNFHSLGSASMSGAKLTFASALTNRDSFLSVGTAVDSIGRFTVSDGSVIRQDTSVSGTNRFFVRVGDGNNSDGTMTLSGLNTHLDLTTGGAIQDNDGFVIAYGGGSKGVVNVEAGAKISQSVDPLGGATRIILGRGDNSNATLNVDGIGSLLDFSSKDNAEMLQIGRGINSTATLNITGGGKVTNENTGTANINMYMGKSSGSTANLNIIGAGSEFYFKSDGNGLGTSGGRLHVGGVNGSTGNVLIKDGGKMNLYAKAIVIGHLGSTGNLTIDNASYVNTFKDNPDFVIARSAGSTGAVEVKNGGSIECTTAAMTIYLGGDWDNRGNASVSTSTLKVHGEGSRISMTGNSSLLVGYSRNAHATAELYNKASLSVANLGIGLGGASNGTFRMYGGATANVGTFGMGIVMTGSNQGASDALAEITGADTSLIVSGNMTMGTNNAATTGSLRFVMGDGARVKVNGTLALNYGSQLSFNLGENDLVAADSPVPADAILTIGTLSVGDIANTQINIVGSDAAAAALGDFKMYILDYTSSALTQAQIESLVNIDGFSSEYWNVGDLEWDGNKLFLNLEVIRAIPEPSTYAAIFGALALALAAYRRRK